MIPTSRILQDNIALRPNESLRQRHIGLFKIIRVLSDLVYEVDLPSTIRAHPVFHISTLWRYKPNTSPFRKTQPLPIPEIINGEEELEVERILDHCIRYQRDEYLIQWKHKAAHDSAWLPWWNLENCQELVEEYHQASCKERAVTPYFPSHQSSSSSSNSSSTNNKLHSPNTPPPPSTPTGVVASTTSTTPNTPPKQDKGKQPAPSPLQSQASPSPSPSPPRRQPHREGKSVRGRWANLGQRR